jgi:hypothetical protein
MNTEIHVDEWRSGTEAIGLCMICGGEYETTRRECPDCHVSLSVVRRCPKCRRIVSAQHTKCVYCRTPFTHELPENASSTDEAPTTGRPRTSKGVQRFRAAAVSLVTFMVVFILGFLFLRQVHREKFPLHTVAKSYLLRSVELRRAPSSGSSSVDTVAAGTNVNLIGYQSGEQGQRWMTVDWHGRVAYAPAEDLAPPKALDTNEGADVLKFYLLGMENAEDIDEAVRAVNYYAKAFPGDIHGEELRWILAERIRYWGQHGGPRQAALRQQARQQYEQIEASKGSFSAKAHDAMATNLLATGSGARASSLPTGRKAKVDGLQVVGGAAEVQTSTVKSTGHEVLVLNRAQVIVHAEALSQLIVGAVISGRVAHAVKANGIVAIPEGAPCQLRVTRTGSSDADVSLGLTSIEIDHRAYAVKSSAVETPSGNGAADRALVFHLDAPLVIER